jgi:hypothetical protein
VLDSQAADLLERRVNFPIRILTDSRVSVVLDCRASCLLERRARNLIEGR